MVCNLYAAPVLILLTFFIYIFLYTVTPDNLCFALSPNPD